MPTMTARSVVLSVLLGAHPACASAGELVRLTSDFGIKESTLRVVLTRMVGAGDLIRSADGYRLSDRLLARQRRQDDAIDPRVRPWRGEWFTLIVTSVGSDARTRAALRTAMHDKRNAVGGWCLESGKGRIVGFLPGHLRWAYRTPQYREMLWRAVHWAMKRDIPPFPEA